MLINHQSLQLLERHYRANLINCLSGYKPASLIGTTDDKGRSNLAIFSNIVHLGADPALVGFVNRPREAAPHTLANIEKTGWYTINHIPASHVSAAHRTSAKYAEGESEFDAVGFTPEWREGITAPFVRESLVKYALKLKEIIPIQWNQTFFVIGSVELILIPEEVVCEDGYLNLEIADSICSLGIDGYYRTEKIARYAYAKPHKPSEVIE